MGMLWALATEMKDLGVVAEQCPFCERVAPCLVRAEREGGSVFFVKLASITKETSCRCKACDSSFRCERWRYSGIVPVHEAASLSIDDLLARTNPALGERLALKQQVASLGGDARFTTAYEQLEGLRPGELHAGLLAILLHWGVLGEEQRDCLVQRISTHSRAWQFARQIAPVFPGHGGCISAFLAVLVVSSALMLAPVVRGWLWWAVAAGVVFAIAAVGGHQIVAERVRRWTREVLVPEAQRANVSLACLLTVVDDLPGTRLSVLEDLWPLKDQIETIRKVLVADKRL